MAVAPFASSFGPVILMVLVAMTSITYRLSCRGIDGTVLEFSLECDSLEGRRYECRVFVLGSGSPSIPCLTATFVREADYVD
jgi:hypothetical protein